MPNYRRYHVPGGTFFFTVNLADRRSRLLTDRIGDFKRAYAQTVRDRPARTLALCVLPNHLHMVWQLPACPGPDPGATPTTRSGSSSSLCS